MLGLLCWQDRGTVRVERRSIAGLDVACALVAGDGVWKKRRLARAAALLRRHGVRRMLPVLDFEVKMEGLPEIDPMPLYRAMAAEFVLQRMKLRHIAPERATVVLRGDYPDGDLTAAARRLCPFVRQVRVETGRGAEGLQKSLYRQFGAAVDTGRNGADTVFVRFSGEAEGEELVFSPGSEERAGLTLDVPGLVLPARLVRPAAVCALWQAGLVGLDRVQVAPLSRKNVLDIR